MKTRTVVICLLFVAVAAAAVGAVVVYRLLSHTGPVLVLKPKGKTTSYEWADMGKGNSFVSSDGKCRVGNDITGFPLLFVAGYTEDDGTPATVTEGTVVICSGCESFADCGTLNGNCDELQIEKLSDQERLRVEYANRDGLSCKIIPMSHWQGRTTVPQEYFEVADTGQAYVIVDGNKRKLTTLTVQTKKNL